MMTSCLQDSTIKHREVGTLAASVMSILASRSQALEDARLEHRATELLNALATGDPYQRAAFLRRCAQHGVSDAHLIDRVIPEAAHQLGRDWLADRLGFDAVSLATLQLQEALQDIHQRIQPFEPDGRRGSVLLALMPGEQHRLGARVLASGLMRTGHAVRILASADADALARALDADECDGLFFSCSHRRAVDAVAGALAGLRATRSVPLTIMGGLVLNHESELERDSGVDLVTNDFGTACLRMARAQTRVRERG